MRNYIRQSNYAMDYFTTAYELYTKHYPAFYVNYYKLDSDESILEDCNFNAGTYEKIGIGELSGAVWKKIINVPIYGVEQVSPSSDSGDYGYTLKESLTTSFNIPEIIGIKPTPWDFIDLTMAFKTDKSFTRTIFVITNFDTAHFGDYLQLYKIYSRVAPFRKDELETQISSYWKFYELTKEILPLSNSVILEKILSKTENIKNNLNENFNSFSNFYLIPEEN